MAKKEIKTSEITSASGAAAGAARVEKPTAKRAPNTKHSAVKNSVNTPVSNATGAPAEEIAVLDKPVVGAIDVALDREAVAKLAYLYWEARGCQHGSPELDWARAEEELRNKN
jgi:hypothetical protein